MDLELHTQLGSEAQHDLSRVAAEIMVATLLAEQLGDNEALLIAGAEQTEVAGETSTGKPATLVQMADWYVCSPHG